MKRFLKIFSLLIVSLFLLMSGVDAALDRLSHSAMQSSYSLYSETGDIVFAYNGDLGLCESYGKPSPITPRHFLPRVKANS